MSTTSPSTSTRTGFVFGSNGSVDPKSIEDYLAIGGYAALAKAFLR